MYVGVASEVVSACTYVGVGSEVVSACMWEWVVRW